MIVRFRNWESMVKKILAVLGGVLFVLFSMMGGFMTWNYLSDNLGAVPKVLILVIGFLMAGIAV